MEIFIAILGLLGFVSLTAATGLFVAIEFALTGMERSAVDRHVEEKQDSTARLVRKAHGELSFVLSGAQLGITVTTLATGFLAEPILAKFLAPALATAGLNPQMTSTIAMILSLIIATALSMVFGELVPKNLAIAKPLPTARATVRPVWVFNSALKHFIGLMNRTANAIVRKLGIEPTEELASARSAEELSALVKNSTGDGGFSQAKATILDKSLRFGDSTAEELMTPRSTVETLQGEDTALDLIHKALATGHSRFPVINGDLDDTIGVVHIKDAFTVAADRRAFTMVKNLCRPVPIVPGSLGGDAVLNHVRSAGSQLVLVADEYGGTSGIVTIEDVVEEIVGEVWDEHDDREADAEVRQSGRTWEIAGLVRIDELAESVGYAAPEGPYETLGGLIMAQLGRIPKEGDRVLLPTSDREFLDGFETGLPNRWLAEVAVMDNRRVEKAVLRPLTEAELERWEADHER